MDYTSHFTHAHPKDAPCYDCKRIRQPASTTTERELCERRLCGSCETEITTADYEAGACTNCGHKLEARTMSENEWQWANNSPIWLNPRRTVYFLIKRHSDGTVEYRNNKRGHLITYRTREQAIKIQDKLNTDNR